MREAAELIRAMKIAEDLVLSGKLDRKAVDECYERCKTMSTLDAANEIAKLVIPPVANESSAPGDVAA